MAAPPTHGVLEKSLRIYQPLMHFLALRLGNTPDLLLVGRMIDTLAGGAQLQALIAPDDAPSASEIIDALREKLKAIPAHLGGDL